MSPAAGGAQAQLARATSDVRAAEVAGAVARPVGAAEGALGAITGPAGVAVGLALGAAYAGSKLAGAISQDANDLAPFSGAISGAQAMNEMRRLEADIAAANRLGGTLATAEESSGRLDRAWDRFSRDFDAAVSPIINMFRDATSTVLESAGNLIEQAAGGNNHGLMAPGNRNDSILMWFSNLEHENFEEFAHGKWGWTGDRVDLANGNQFPGLNLGLNDR